jgi:hypothetical protein
MHVRISRDASNSKVASISRDESNKKNSNNTKDAAIAGRPATVRTSGTTACREANYSRYQQEHHGCQQQQDRQNQTVGQSATLEKAATFSRDTSNNRNSQLEQ